MQSQITAAHIVNDFIDSAFNLIQTAYMSVIQDSDKSMKWVTQQESSSCAAKIGVYGKSR